MNLITIWRLIEDHKCKNKFIIRRHTNNENEIILRCSCCEEWITNYRDSIIDSHLSRIQINKILDEITENRKEESREE